jgi:hypothetical protein
VTCPQCGSHDIGRIAPDHFYCWECCVEISVAAGRCRIFAVDAEGVLVPLDGEGAPSAGAVPSGSAAAPSA